MGKRSSAGVRKIYKRKDDQTVANSLQIRHGHNGEILNMIWRRNRWEGGGGTFFTKIEMI